MAGITSAMPDSYRSELAQALHNHTITSGNVFYIPLFKATVTGTYGKATTNYTDMTGNSDEASGTGYTATGFHWTAAQNITPTIPSANTATWSWSVNPSWTTATFTTDGAMIYNQTNGQRAVGVFSFGSTQTVTAGTLTLVLPANTAAAAILRLA